MTVPVLVGEDEGREEGTAWLGATEEGALLGERVFRAEGAVLGDTEGDREGEALVWIEGVRVGQREGRGVTGRREGAREGAKEGFTVSFTKLGEKEREGAAEEKRLGFGEGIEEGEEDEGCEEGR